MSAKLKTQVAATPTPAAATGKVGGQSLFDSQDTQTETDDALDYDDSQVFAGGGDPPKSQLQRAEQHGYHFENIEIAAYKPAVTPFSKSPFFTRAAPPRLQRQAIEAVKERRQGAAINLSPYPFTYGNKPLATQITHTGEQWEDGAVTLKAENPLASKITHTGEQWEDGMVTLKAESAPEAGNPESLIQAKVGDGSFAVGSQIENRLQSNKGGGQPLSENTRDFMESRFGNDFSGVRVHTNAAAVQMNRDLKAQAFTHGKDIYFNASKYNPESTGGKRLLAHELTHTIQQTGPSAVNPKRLAKKAEKANKKAPAQAVAAEVAPKAQRQSIAQAAAPTDPSTQAPSPTADLLENPALTVQPQLMVGAVGDRYEQEADRMADRVVQLPDVQEPEPDPVQRSPSPPIALKPLAPSVSPVSEGILQRDKKDDIKADAEAAIKQVNEEIDSQKKEAGEAGAGVTGVPKAGAGEADTTAADKAAEAGRRMAKEAQDKLTNADSEEKAEEEAGELEQKSDEGSKKVQDEGEKTEKDETQKQKAEAATLEKEGLEEQEKQAQETEEAAQNVVKKEGQSPEAAEDADKDPEAAAKNGIVAAGADATTEAVMGEQPDQPPLEHLSDPGMAAAPEEVSEPAPTSPEDDPAFAAVVSQSQHLAAKQSAHKPADQKSEEAQDAAQDPVQQIRSAQATQSNEAGEKQPQLFDREGFISALLAVLESNKPKSQKEVEQGKGAGGISEQVTTELDKVKAGAGAGLPESATREPDPTIEAPKAVFPIPDPEAETGEKPPDDLIDPVAATPKAKAESEIETPLAQTKQAIDTLIPKDRSALPPLQAKLTVGAPGDKYEQEADRMADAVMAAPAVQPLTEPAKDSKQSPGQPEGAVQTIQPQETATEEAPDNPVTPANQAPDNPANPGTVQRQPGPINLPDIQAPGLYLQRQAVLEAETITQEELEVPLDEHRLQQYEKEAGVDASGAIEAAQQHFGGTAQAEFRQTETATLVDTESVQTDTVVASNEDMFADRLEEFTNVRATQHEAQLQDESERSRVSQEIQAIYDETKVNVNGILADMDAKVAAEFAATDKQAKAVFEARQKQLFKEWKHDYYFERHPLLIPWMEVKTGWSYVKVRFYLKKFFNLPLWAINKVFTGLPDEVNQIYEIARDDYLAVQREGVYRIADIVEEGLAKAKAEVDHGRQRVQEYVTALPQNLQSLGAEAAANVQAQFDGLEQSIRDKQTALATDLKAKYEASLEEIDERIEALKAANASLVSKIGKALLKIAKWILRQVLNILKPPLKLIPGIGSKAGKFLDAFVDDPGGVLKALFKGVGEGFKKFGKNIKKHIINGLFEWLLGSGLSIKFPDKFDLQGIIDILLQILGVSKDAILGLAASLLPSWASELLQMLVEQGVGALSNIMDSLNELGVPAYVIGFFKAIAELPAKGVMALWDFIKTVFSSLKGAFITALVTQLIIPEVVIAGIQWIIGLLNPVSGILKIAKAIIDVIIFLVNNREMIFEVLKAIGNVFSAIISKSWAPIATAVEFALANIIPLALGLFVSLLGLGGIPQRIGKVVETLRTPVDKGLSTVLDKVGMLLDPVGAVEGGVAGLGDAVAKKRKGKGDKDDPAEESDDKPATDQKSDRSPPGKATSTKETSEPAAEASTSQKPKPDAKSGKADQPDSKSGIKERPDQQSAKDKKPTKDEPAKGDQADDSEHRLRSAMATVDRLAEEKRDPGAVEKELPEIKQKYDLDLITLTKRGKRQYGVRGKATADTSRQKKKTKVRRQPLSGASAAPTLQRSLFKKSSKSDDWRDPSNEVSLTKKLKFKKKRGGNFSVNAKLIAQDDILPEVAKKLKRYIKRDARVARVEEYVARLKIEYKLKTLKLIRKEPDGSKYEIIGELDKRPNKSVQRMAMSRENPRLAVNPAIETQIQRAEGGGQAIAAEVRAPLEQVFSTDFSPVRIHTDTEGDRLSRSLEAKAFTTGRDIFFRQGAYAPESRQGRHLLAHELTHVVQQSGARPTIMPRRVQRQGADPPPLQRSPQSLGLWVQREVDDGSADDGEMSDGAALAGGLALVAAGAAVDAGTEVVTDAIADRMSSDIEIESTINKEKTCLKMSVEDKDSESEEETQDETAADDLPISLVNSIVRVIQDIVDQNPDRDTVADKLDKVRVLFEMSLVKLVGYAEVGDAFEYTIKIKGRAKFIRASKIAKFLKRLGRSARHAGERMAGKRNTQAEQPVTAAEQPAAPAPPVQSPAPDTPKPAKTIGPDAASPDAKATTPAEPDNTPNRPLEKASPSSTKPEDKSKAKIEQAQEHEIEIQSKVRRIDAETVDVIIRATPQNKTR